MTIQQLQYILEVNRTRSITQAAKNLYVTQAGISSAISSLEDELGFQIFARSWQGAIPTERGVRVLEQASRICEHHRVMVGGDPSRARSVRIETGQYLPMSTAFIKLAKECRDRSDVFLIHENMNKEKVRLEKLSIFEADIVVMMILMFDSNVESRLEWERKEREKMGLEMTVHRAIPTVIRIGPGHHLYDVPDLRPEDFGGEIIIDTPNATMVKSNMMQPFVGSDPDRVLLEANQTMRYRMVTEGLGYMVGCKFPQHINEEYGFRSIPLEGLNYHLVSIVNPGRPLSPEAKRYLELLEEELEGL